MLTIFFGIYMEHTQMHTAPPVFATSSYQTSYQMICYFCTWIMKM